MIRRQVFPTILQLCDPKTSTKHITKATIIFTKPKEIVSNTLYVIHDLDSAIPYINHVHFFTCKKNSLIEYNHEYISYADAKMYCEHDICKVSMVIGRIIYWDIDDTNSAYIVVDRMILKSKA